MKHIGNLTYAEGSRHKKKRIGRGEGSGHGGTSTRGHKGQQSRSGASQMRGFEGGQMPLSRRLPKYGFNNPFRIEYQEVNVSTLQHYVDKGSITDGIVTPEVLFAVGATSKRTAPVKILGNGDLTSKLHITADKFTQSAQSKIEAVGGTVTINE